jgi:hypothetical protein
MAPPSEVRIRRFKPDHTRTSDTSGLTLQPSRRHLFFPTVRLPKDLAASLQLGCMYGAGVFAEPSSQAAPLSLQALGMWKRRAQHVSLEWRDPVSGAFPEVPVRLPSFHLAYTWQV